MKDDDIVFSIWKHIAVLQNEYEVAIHTENFYFYFRKERLYMKKLTVISGIYKIVNLVNGNVYIGESYHCIQRRHQHLRELKKNRHSNTHLQRAWNKYGEENFKFVIIETCPENIRYLRERYWIAKYQANITGYNQSGGGEGEIGIRYNKERNEKISKTMTGKKFLCNSRSNSARAVVVYCLNDDKRFGCVKDACDFYNLTSTAVIRSYQQHITVSKNSNLVFLIEKEYNEYSKNQRQQIIQEAVNKRKKPNANSRAIICLNTREEFPNAKSACAKYGGDYSYLGKCCKGEVYSSGKDENGIPLVWMKKSDYLKADKEFIQRRIDLALKNSTVNIPVICVTTNKSFASIKEASDYYSISVSTISYCIKKKALCKAPNIKEMLEWKRK